MAVSTPAVSEKPVRLPTTDQPFAYIGGDPSKPVFLDPVWRRALQSLADKDAAIAELLNDVRAEVNARHP